MRYTISFILEEHDYYYDTATLPEALLLYYLINEKYPNVEELEVYDSVEGKYIRGN